MQLTAKANTLCLLEILKDYTDRNHTLKMSEIISKMESIYGLKVERRTIYSCVNVLTEMGYSVLTPEDTGSGYCLDEHDFDASEIRLLMDSVEIQQYLIIMVKDTNKKFMKYPLQTNPLQ